MNSMHDKQAAGISLASPLIWLARGWRDLRRAPLPGLVHGLCVMLFGALLLSLAGSQFWWLAGAFSGFMLVAPVVATGLYSVSRGLERGEPVGLREVLALWRSRDARLVGFGLLLGLVGTVWVLTSASLLAWLAPAPINSLQDFLRHLVLADSPFLFELWMLCGGLLAAPVFASSVLTMPMLLDRDCSLESAVRASWRAVADYPLVSAFWALLIVLLVLVGLLTWLLGLLVVTPWLGHASWHAYRDLSASAIEGGR
jgi:uncharacterized membrane protein